VITIFTLYASHACWRLWAALTAWTKARESCACWDPRTIGYRVSAAVLLHFERPVSSHRPTSNRIRFA
jgi:hypothetical protein